MLVAVFAWRKATLMGPELEEVDVRDVPTALTPCERKYPLYQW